MTTRIISSDGRGARGGGFIRQVRVEGVTSVAGYPYGLPVVRHLLESGELALDPGVTFLVGDNGTGKSTLAEAIAVAAGFNAEGGQISRPALQPESRQLPLRPRRTRRRLPADEA
jgi:predicted ATPase